MRYDEDFEVGYTPPRTAPHLVTEAKVFEIGRRGDPQPFHTDPEANHAPARPGDQLRFRWTVIDRRLSKSRPGEGVVCFRGTLVNQRDEPVFSNENPAKFKCRPA